MIEPKTRLIKLWDRYDNEVFLKIPLDAFQAKKILEDAEQSDGPDYSKIANIAFGCFLITAASIVIAGVILGI
jgi:hypothetical protein